MQRSNVIARPPCVARCPSPDRVPWSSHSVPVRTPRSKFLISSPRLTRCHPNLRCNGCMQSPSAPPSTGLVACPRLLAPPQRRWLPAPRAPYRSCGRHGWLLVAESQRRPRRLEKLPLAKKTLPGLQSDCAPQPRFDRRHRRGRHVCTLFPCPPPPRVPPPLSCPACDRIGLPAALVITRRPGNHGSALR
jgi:hypothetical protein